MKIQIPNKAVIRSLTHSGIHDGKCFCTFSGTLKLVGLLGPQDMCKTNCSEVVIDLYVNDIRDFRLGQEIEIEIDSNYYDKMELKEALE